MSGVSVTSRFGSEGYFRVFVTPPGGKQTNVSMVRGVPTKIGSMTTSDPFGCSTAQVTFPAITARDRGGAGDLKWLVPNSNLDIIWYDSAGKATTWSWEGYLVSEDFGSQGRAVTAKGALYQVDNFKAVPTYPEQPIPYEILIKEDFDPTLNPSLRTHPLKTVFPSDWTTVVPTYTSATPSYLRPWGVKAGQKWTGLSTRSTGSWEGRLTGHVQTLLGVMYTDNGQWTVYHNYGRQPVLQVREALRFPVDATYVVHVGIHGVDASVTRDFSETANVVYATGTDLAGTTYSGMEVTNDGQTTYYEPFAALPQVYPAADTNKRLIPSMMRVETQLQLPQGIDQITAKDVAAQQVRKHADPGYTGTITLTIDPTLYGSGAAVPRFLIRAGETILLKGLAGTDVLFHITQSSVDFEGGSVALTVDSKFRDALTVAEVMARTRDALDPVRLLQTGKYSVTIQDTIKPWSYSDGSGIIPSGGKQDATKLFNTYMSASTVFPWTDYTKKYPPKKYPQFYIKLNAKSTNATNNWAGYTRDGKANLAIPVKLSQAGSIRLIQVAAYDENGNVLKVRFHFGVYGSSGTNATSMPSIPADWIKTAEGKATGYKAGQHYPFFPGAFEQQNADGTIVDDNAGPQLLADGTTQFIAWGNYYEPAGYSPGLKSRGAPKTGMLVDESTWAFDTSKADPNFPLYDASNIAKNKSAGLGYVMVYCDDQGTKPIYFLGRMFRVEPTGS